MVDVKNTVKVVMAETNIDNLVENYNNFMTSFSCKPDRDVFPYPKVGDVLDEDKSVKWNRDEVARLREVYDAEVKKLNSDRNTICNAYETQIKFLLSEDYGLNSDEVNKLWSYAYAEGHAYGVREVVSQFKDVASLYTDLLSVHTKGGKK